MDEAHCISQWGQDFRPSYLKILDFVKSLPKRPVVAAFTATATEAVRRDVVRILELNDPVCVITGFDRPNLRYEVHTGGKKDPQLLRLLREREGKSGIVYCATRKKAESVCELLCCNGIAATHYHAGLSEAERSRNQADFVYDRKPVMVATNAFGMGIDKSEELRSLRRELADTEGIAAYMVFSDATLRDMAAKAPRSESEFLAISGVGAFKLKKYGKAFLDRIARHT